MNDEFSLKKTIDLPVIESSGGLVYNDNYHILLIFKRGKWDLPKGRVKNKDSSKVQTALREVMEETGLDREKLVVKGKLVPTWHTTIRRNQKYLKKTHWYLMHYQGNDADLLPQIEEGIIECRWVNVSELDSYRLLLLTRIQYVIDFCLENLAYIPRE